MAYGIECVGRRPSKLSFAHPPFVTRFVCHCVIIKASICDGTWILFLGSNVGVERKMQQTQRSPARPRRDSTRPIERASRYEYCANEMGLIDLKQPVDRVWRLVYGRTDTFRASLSSSFYCLHCLTLLVTLQTIAAGGVCNYICLSVYICCNWIVTLYVSVYRIILCAFL